jgi:hypothetical protein
MTLIAEDLEALAVQGRTVAETVRINYLDGSIEAVQFIFTDGLSLTLAVWTDWRLVAELRSGAVIPDYLWPPEATRSPIEHVTGLVVGVVPRHNEIGELVGVHITVGNRRMSVLSFAGDLTIDLPQH